LYRFPARSLLVLLQALPLLLPSFLLAIGWSNLVAAHWLPGFYAPAGLAGTVFILGMQAIPLPFFATWAACCNLTASQVDAARLHGGEFTVLRLSAKSCVAPAILSAMLGGVLSLSDSGAPIILGCRVASVEVLTSFSALFDFGLAARQCFVLASLVLLLSAPVLLFGLPSLAAAVLARQTRAAIAYPHRRLGQVAIVALIAIVLLGLAAPSLGLCLPAIKSRMLGRATETLERTWADTFISSSGAGLIAVVLSAGLALAVGRQPRLRLIVLGVLLGLFALPPALAGFGVVQLATKAPAELDWLTRGWFTVALVLGLRFLPIATLVMMRAVGSLSPTWADAARLHGVSFSRYLCRVVLPLLKPALAVSLILIMVLATADITTVLLVQPPGRATLPVAIFTVMANSPEGLVASLCLLYVAGVIVVMAIATLLARWWARRVG
jgi:iron(III) transport system permease protein